LREYTFICPLAGCGTVLSIHADNADQGQTLLTVEAEKHLQEIHPDIHKTHEEVALDIKSHMQEK
jgi:hypothetical protein